MILKTFSAILVLLYFYSAAGLAQSYKKPRAYKVWVQISDNQVAPSGILYKIDDSLITVSSSIRDTFVRVYNFHDIELLKIRRINGQLKVGIIGSAVGFTGGIVAVNLIEGGLSFLTLPVSAVAGLYFGAIGAGCGILAGSIKDRIGIHYSFENFDKYRGNLQNYSFVHENIPVKKIFDHRVYLEINIGLSFAQDEFISGIPFDGYLGMEKTGSNFNISGGYRINEVIGLKVSLINNMYSVRFKEDYSSGASINREVSWALDAFLAGPVISLPVYRQLFVNFSPSIGYASASLVNDDKFTLNGVGLALHINGAFVYNYSKRWYASAGIGYLSSEQKYKEGGSGQSRSINIIFGIAYKFGRKSL